MPLSEFLAKTTKPNSTMNTSSSPFYLSDNEFVELDLLENGQIVMHDHSSRPKNSPERSVQQSGHADICTSNNANGNGFSNINSKGNDILGAEDEEDMVSWIHNSLNDPLRSSSPLRPDPLHADFCFDVFERFSGTNQITLDFTSTVQVQANNAGAGTELELSMGETNNLSMFKEWLASRAKASTSTMNRNATDRELIRVNEKKSSKSKIMHAPVLAASSVCSVNDEAIESTDQPNHVAGKKKIREGDESSNNSEDKDDESAGEKRVAIGRGAFAKKSRASEVHNMSERRRRERINEKMKALQELIPNCRKEGKASMLDDAIEYLKTLQHQVQMLSMGNGMYMPPPVMIPPWVMQPLQGPPMAHYPPLGLGLCQMGMYPQVQVHPQQFIPGPHAHAMHGMISPMPPLHPQVPVPASVNTQPTQVGSSSENDASTAAGASVGSEFNIFGHGFQSV